MSNSILKFIEDNALTLTPNAFKVVYEYFEGDILGLKRDVLSALQKDTLSNTEIEKIYARYFSAPQSILVRIGTLLDLFGSQILGLSQNRKTQQLEMGISLMQKEIAQLQRQLENEKNRSMKDALTGLGNRFEFEEQIEKSITDKPRSIVIVDIDHFKRLNDDHGHQVGDEALRQLGEAIRSTLKENDVATRYGGEEFVIFIDGDEDQAILYSEALQKEVSNILLDSEHSDNKVDFSLSIGVAQIDDSPTHAFNQADRCLYYAKKNGRDQITYQSCFEASREPGVR